MGKAIAWQLYVAPLKKVDDDLPPLAIQKLSGYTSMPRF
jgi:hypothetical protein